jgi:hypothetical protein
MSICYGICADNVYLWKELQMCKTKQMNNWSFLPGFVQNSYESACVNCSVTVATALASS